MNFGGSDTIRLRNASARASKLIGHFGVTKPEHIVVEDMAFDRGVIIQDRRINGAEAWLLRQGKRGIVRVSDRIREAGRRRFAIAHELGHWECHMGESQAWLCTSGDIHAYRGSSVELEANAFAAELLMPHDLFAPYLGRDVSIAQLCNLSETFNTTLTATAVRFVEESPEDCYVVFSTRDAQVRWWRRGSRGTDYRIPANHRIPYISSAYHCTDQPQSGTEMRSIRGEIWFPNTPDIDRYEVWEESVALGEYDIVLTLLWLMPA